MYTNYFADMMVLAEKFIVQSRRILYPINIITFISFEFFMNY